MGVKSVGYYQGAALSAANSLADIVGAVVPASADYAVVQCETQNCRWRDDGTAPTATVGNLLVANVILTIRRGQFSRFKIIEATASAKVSVDFYKTG